jgi:hydrogenase/urease accessory protein HupE
MVESEASWQGADPASAEIALLLTGSIPGGARTFAWENSLKLGSYLLTIRTEGEETPARQWVEGGERSQPFPLASAIRPPTRREVALQYLKLGYTHILPKGADHILFVVGIFLLSTRLKPVLLQVTAFTVAHTITLALTIYGVVSLPSAVVEPLIAASIVYVAVENVVRPRLSAWRVALVFAFGLLHGMGFAGVLSRLGLPRSEFLTALLCFNAGVELGQLSVIVIAFLLLGLPFRHEPWYRRRVVVPASLAIAAVGMFWAVQRIL